MRRMDSNTLAIIIGGAILVLVAVLSWMYRNKRIKSGKITNRKGRFFGETHIFMARAPFSAFCNALAQFNVGADKINVQGNGASGRLTFTGPSWNAQIVQAQTVPGMPNKFVFDFTGYRSRNGVPLGAISMNVLLTAIEKAFLMTDLDATVTRQPKAMKTKTSFF